MLAQRRARIERLGLDAEAVEKIFRAIICLSKQAQRRAIGAAKP
jgi:chorismate mutase